MKNLLVFTLILTLLSACMKSEKPTVLKNNYTPVTPKLASDIMTPEVLWSFGRIGGAQVSPDGISVIYGVTYFNIAENKSYRDIYTIAVSGGEAKMMVEDGEAKLNGNPESRKRAKLRVGDVIEIFGKSITIQP